MEEVPLMYSQVLALMPTMHMPTTSKTALPIMRAMLAFAVVPKRRAKSSVTKGMMKP